MTDRIYRARMKSVLELQRRIDAADLSVRREYRHDQSSALVFECGARPSTARTQDTLTVALIVAR